MTVPAVIMSSNASGAVEIAKIGYVVMVVDIIDMSTTLEALLDAGAAAVFGASPDNARPPVPVEPEKIGLAAGRKARQLASDIIVVAEPRIGSDGERRQNIKRVIKGIEQSGAKLGALIPNLGAETPHLLEASGRVVVAATGTGGVAYDAAYTAGAPAVITGTIARTPYKKGSQPARDSARRAIAMARELRTGIGVVAASGNSLEDLLAAEYIAKLIMEQW